MGRIDDALRRSGHRTVLRPSGGDESATGDVFVSPWAFRDGAKPVPAPNVREERDSARVMPVSTVPVERARPREDVPPPFTGTELHRIRGFSGAWMERLVIAPSADRLFIEQFRQLAATLHQARTENNTRVVMVTSANEGEGKSLTVVNLALTLSDSYHQRVLLIDADLRRPSLHEMAGVPNASGLGDTLKSSVEQKLPVYQLSDTLLFVPAGQPDPDPVSALTSARMHHIVTEATTHFDWILIDAPPIGPIVDSTLLVPNIDAAILVVRAGRTPYADVKRAVDTLGTERILGVVLNGAENTDRGAYRSHYHAPDLDAGGARRT